jgi:flagellin-specific chaperone FliS
MSKPSFKPYANEADAFQIDDLNIENRLDRVSIFGSLDITLDQEGLKKAKELKILIDATLAELEKADLPKKISILPTETVSNPFA